MHPENVTLLNIDLLIPNPNQPRKTFNEVSLNELAASIKKYGILNPILVRKKENLYEIIAGERRYRAAKISGITEVPVIIKDIDDSKIAEIALIENLQRENITPIEEAKAYDEILKVSNINEQNLGELIGKSQSFISNKLRLLKLPNEIQEALNNKKISEKHARSLLTINNQDKQIELLNKIINEKLSVKELDSIISNQKEEKESDNMNNGNFFPNFNNPEQNNQNVSLNQMNMQTINVPTEQSVIQPNAVFTEQTIPEPTINSTSEIISTTAIPQVEIQNMEPPIAPTEPVMPELNSAVNSPIFDFGINNTTTPAPMMAEVNQNSTSIIENPTIQSVDNSTNQTINTPLFDNNPVEPQASLVNEPISEPVVTPNEPINNFENETPLFNNDLNNNQTPNLNESFYEVPVNVSPVIEEPREDKFTSVQQLLSSNNIEYKAYSNENGHCIIIEL